jgi:hypothetical protein
MAIDYENIEFIKFYDIVENDEDRIDFFAEICTRLGWTREQGMKEMGCDDVYGIFGYYQEMINPTVD